MFGKSIKICIINYCGQLKHYFLDYTLNKINVRNHPVITSFFKREKGVVLKMLQSVAGKKEV